MRRPFVNSRKREPRLAVVLEKAPLVERYPVMRPTLPTYDRLEPYLRRIDAARTYSNYGPLVREFEARAAQLLGMPGCLTSAGSGTAALAAAILASAGRATPERPFALLPAYTFVATALAVELCGYRPLVAEIDASDWMLSPSRARTHVERGDIGLVVPVSPYGRAFDQRHWHRFRDETGVPVVIDAAASYDVLANDPAAARAALGPIPVALSFHATKSFSCGEGGAVVSSDARLLHGATQALNLGFYGSRDCTVASFNGKLSEYHAAVGLAELDGWPQKRATAKRIASAYRVAATSAGIADRVHVAPSISGCYVLFEAASADEATAVQTALTVASIGSRFWYGAGIHGHTHFAGVAQERVPTAEDVAGRLLGLPVASDYSSDDVAAIVEALARAL
jgi:dTDP-4-amino-4,6-dideoxygalactose transaminase